MPKRNYKSKRSFKHKSSKHKRNSKRNSKSKSFKKRRTLKRIKGGSNQLFLNFDNDNYLDKSFSGEGLKITKILNNCDEKKGLVQCDRAAYYYEYLIQSTSTNDNYRLNIYPNGKLISEVPAAEADAEKAAAENARIEKWTKWLDYYEELQEIINSSPNSDNFYISKLFGVGSVGSEKKEGGKKSVEINIINIKDIKDTEDTKNKEEIKNIKKINHTLIEIDETNKFFIHEICSLSLKTFIRKILNNKPNVNYVCKLIINILIQISEALQFLHKHNYIYYGICDNGIGIKYFKSRDLDSVKVRLNFLNLIKKINNDEKVSKEFNRGMPLFEAPEDTDYTQYSQTNKIDVFSFGMLIVHILDKLAFDEYKKHIDEYASHYHDPISVPRVATPEMRDDRPNHHQSGD